MSSLELSLHMGQERERAFPPSYLRRCQRQPLERELVAGDLFVWADSCSAPELSAIGDNHQSFPVPSQETFVDPDTEEILPQNVWVPRLDQLISMLANRIHPHGAASAAEHEARVLELVAKTSRERGLCAIEAAFDLLLEVTG